MFHGPKISNPNKNKYIFSETPPQSFVNVYHTATHAFMQQSVLSAQVPPCQF